MPFGGPRLDRPSAVGDEGRPRAASLVVATVLTLGFLLVTVYFLQDTPNLLTLSGLSEFLGVPSRFAVPAALTVAGLAMLNRDRIATRVLGHVIFYGGGILFIVTLLSVSVLAVGVLLAGFTVGLFGLAATWADTADGESLTNALRQAAIAYIVLLFLLLVATVVALAAGVLRSQLSGLAGTTDPVQSVVGFAFVVVVLAVSLLLAVWTVPLVSFVAPEERSRVKVARRRVERAAVVTAVVGVLIAGVAAVVPGPLRGLDDVPPFESLFVLISSPFVFGPVLLAGLGALGLSILTKVADSVADRRGERHRQHLSAIGGAICLVIVMTPLLLLGFAGENLVGIFVLAALIPLVVLAGGALLLVAHKMGLLPGRAAGPAIAASGLFLAALGASTAPVPGVLVFALVAGSLVVWDVSAFGLGVTAELGHRPETRRLELYHGVVSGSVGLGTVVLATVLGVVAFTVGGGVAVAPAAAVAVVGVLILSVPLAR